MHLKPVRLSRVQLSRLHPKWSRRLRLLAVAGLPLLFSACVGDRVLQRSLPTDEDEEVLIVDEDASAPVSDAGRLEADPHSLRSVDPNHGPFTGGQTAIIRGNGFSSEMRVWFGSKELPSSAVLPVDPQRVQVEVPAGSAGMVDVVVQVGDDESTRRELSDGYEYDTFFLEPAGGPVTGGTIVTLFGDDTGWTSRSEVTIDRNPCEVLEVRKPAGEPEEIDCRTPPGSPGKKVVTVTAADGDSISVNGAFTYADTASTFEGGLSGDALDDRLEVQVLNGYTGDRLQGAFVVVGAELDESRIAQTNASGLAVFEDTFEARETVTAGMPCMQPVTLVDVPVDRVTVYLEPMLVPECIPPLDEIPQLGGGGGPAPYNTINGELVFGFGVEFKRGGWINVPVAALPGETQVAYVGELASSSRAAFRLPNRVDATTPDEGGTLGYNFSYDTRRTGNLTLYALAGLETDGPSRKFTPYVLGLLKGVEVGSDERSFIPMNITLDHAISLEVDGPQLTSRGPDRVSIELSLRMGRSGYVPLPQTSRMVLLPSASPVEFVGVPQLSQALEGAQYVSSVRAVSGGDAQLPWSELESVATRSSDTLVPIRNFVEVPQLVSPALNGAWDGSTLSVDWAAGGSRVDLLVFRISSPAGARAWTVIAPGDKRDLQLPPLAELPELGLPPGRVELQVSAARINDFDYATLRERQYGTNGWTAYARDVFPAYLP